MNKFKIISTSLLFIAFLCTGIDAYAQDMNPQARDISLKILNKKGRPIKKVYAQSLNTGIAGFTDQAGLFVFRGMSDNDTMAVNLPKIGKVGIPVAGMDSIVVTVRSSKNYSYVNRLGEMMIVQKERVEPATVLDAQEMMRRRPYKSLSDMLRHVAGFSGGAVRGINSINSSSEPLVVVDGNQQMPLSEADRMINVYDIKTIEVLKDGSGWGVVGSNGVILVTTK
jgi:hypothetical protein